MDRDTLFNALGDSTRRLILDELAERSPQTQYELCVRLIMRHKLEISRQAFAKHIDVLEHAGLVRSEKQGKFRVVVLTSEPLRNLMDAWLK